VPEVLQRLGRECGARAPCTIENDFSTPVRDRVFDFELQESTRNPLGLGDEALLVFVPLAYIEEDGAVLCIDHPRLGLLDGDFPNGSFDLGQELVERGHEANLRFSTWFYDRGPVRMGNMSDLTRLVKPRHNLIFYSIFI